MTIYKHRKVFFVLLGFGTVVLIIAATSGCYKYALDVKRGNKSVKRNNNNNNNNNNNDNNKELISHSIFTYGI